MDGMEWPSELLINRATFGINYVGLSNDVAF